MFLIGNIATDRAEQLDAETPGDWSLGACGAAGRDSLGHPSFPHRVEKLRGPPREQVAALDEPEER